MYDLSRLYVRIDECPTGIKLVDHFDELKCFSEFIETENENIIKTAILTADMESPFLKIKDRKTMIRAVFDFLHVQDTKENKQLYEEIVVYKNTNYLNCFGRYLMIYHDIDWTEYQSTKQTHDVLTMDSMRPMETDEKLAAFVDRKDKVRKMLKATGEELRKLEAKIFPDGKAAREIALNENKKIRTYAEKYSQENTYI
jgi:hypothetical protein